MVRVKLVSAVGLQCDGLLQLDGFTDRLMTAQAVATAAEVTLHDSQVCGSGLHGRLGVTGSTQGYRVRSKLQGYRAY